MYSRIIKYTGDESFFLAGPVEPAYYTGFNINYMMDQLL